MFDPPLTFPGYVQREPATKAGTDWIVRATWRVGHEGPIPFGVTPVACLRGPAPDDTLGARIFTNPILSTNALVRFKRSHLAWCPSCTKRPSPLLYACNVMGNTTSLHQSSLDRCWWCLACGQSAKQPRWKAATAHGVLSTIPPLYALANKHTLHRYTCAQEDLA